MHCDFCTQEFWTRFSLDEHRWNLHRPERQALEDIPYGGQRDDLVLVAPEHACPRCGERQKEHLVSAPDPTEMLCKVCAQYYKLPGRGEWPEPVAEASGCPRCGERRMDWLGWKEPDMAEVECATCGFVYRP